MRFHIYPQRPCLVADLLTAMESPLSPFHSDASLPTISVAPPPRGGALTGQLLLVWLGDEDAESLVPDLGTPCEVVRSDYDCFRAVFSRPHRYHAVVCLPLQEGMIDVIRMLRINGEFSGKIWGVAPTSSAIDWSRLTDGTFPDPGTLRRIGASA